MKRNVTGSCPKGGPSQGRLADTDVGKDNMGKGDYDGLGLNDGQAKGFYEADGVDPYR